MQHRQITSAGFTLVEMLVVVMIISLLFAISAASLGQPRAAINIQTITDTLLQDIKTQQLLSMAGDIGTNTTQQAHGVYVQSTSYTLFSSTTYSGADSNNFTVTPTNGVTFSTTLPSTQVVFNKGAGDVAGFVNGSNTITVSGPGGTSKVITIGRFGALTVN